MAPKTRVFREPSDSQIPLDELLLNDRGGVLWRIVEQPRGLGALS